MGNYHCQHLWPPGFACLCQRVPLVLLPLLCECVCMAAGQRRGSGVLSRLSLFVQLQIYQDSSNNAVFIGPRSLARNN